MFLTGCVAIGAVIRLVGWSLLLAAPSAASTLGARSERDVYVLLVKKKANYYKIVPFYCCMQLLWPPNSSALLSQTFTTTIHTTSQHYSNFQKITFTTSK
jgi:hypothetical protein